MESSKFSAPSEFVANDGGGEAPLEGSIPDMTSSTEHCVNLQKIYQAKAEADFLLVEQSARDILKKIGGDSTSMSKQIIKSFCRNPRKVKVCRYHPIEDKFNSPNLLELQKYLSDDNCSTGDEGHSNVMLHKFDRLWMEKMQL